MMPMGPGPCFAPDGLGCWAFCPGEFLAAIHGGFMGECNRVSLSLHGAYCIFSLDYN